MSALAVRYMIDKNYISNPRRFGENILFQIGKMKSAPGNEISLHAHLNWYELTVVTGGKGKIFTNGEGVDVSTGDIYLSFPSEFHMIRSSEDEPLDFCFFAFRSENEYISRELDDIIERSMLADHRVFCDPRVEFLIENLIGELAEPDIYVESQARSIIEQVICYVIRNFRNVGEGAKGANVSKPEEFCYRMMNYIDTHIYTMGSLSDLADAMHYNYSYMSDLFKKTMSETLNSYYRRRRLETARLLLADGKLSVTQISELLNFSSIYTFSRSYKDYFGASPNETRKSR